MKVFWEEMLLGLEELGGGLALKRERELQGEGMSCAKKKDFMRMGGFVCFVHYFIPRAQNRSVLSGVKVEGYLEPGL